LPIFISPGDTAGDTTNTLFVILKNVFFPKPLISSTVDATREHRTLDTRLFLAHRKPFSVTHFPPMDPFTLQKKLNAIPISAGKLRGNGIQLSNFKAFQYVVNQLAMIPPLAHFARAVQTLEAFQTDADEFQTDVTSASQLRHQAAALFNAVDTLQKILAELVPQVPPETLIITLPSQKDLTFTTNLLEQFQKCLAPLVFEPGIDGKLEVINWQSGSLLVFIFVASMTAVGIVARTLKGAAIAYQEIQKGRAAAVHVDLLKEHVRESQIKNDLANVLAEAERERIKAVIDRESKAVELDIFNNSHNERLQRIKHSVRTLAELFEQGATVSPALNMPQEEQDKFPDVDHLLTAAPPIKQLKAAGSPNPPDSNAPAAAV
jgi:hypothetical protein